MEYIFLFVATLMKNYIIRSYSTSASLIFLYHNFIKQVQ